MKNKSLILSSLFAVFLMSGAEISRAEEPTKPVPLSPAVSDAIKQIMMNPFAPVPLANPFLQLRGVEVTGLDKPTKFLDFKGMTPVGYEVRVFNPDGLQKMVTLKPDHGDKWGDVVKDDTDYISVKYFVKDKDGKLREATAGADVKKDVNSYALDFKVVVGQGTIIIFPADK